MTPSPELSILQQAVRESRHSVSREYSGLLSDLDLRKRFTESVRRHPLGWIGGAAAMGLIATLFGGRRGRASGKGIPATTACPPPMGAFSRIGWIGGAMELGKLLYPILRPVLVEYASRAAQAGLAKRGRP